MRVSEVDFFIVAIDQFLSNSVHYFRVVSLIVLGNKLHTVVVYAYDFRLDVQKTTHV